jgi:hypothetical protein
MNLAFARLVAAHTIPAHRRAQDRFLRIPAGRELRAHVAVSAAEIAFALADDVDFEGSN